MNKQRIIDIIAVISIALILLTLLIPAIYAPRTPCRLNTCINNLRIIECAKELWAREYHKTNGDDVVTSEVNKYIKGNTTPICPNNGTYSYNAIGKDPTCSITNPVMHRLPKRE